MGDVQVKIKKGRDHEIRSSRQGNGWTQLVSAAAGWQSWQRECHLTSSSSSVFRIRKSYQERCYVEDLCAFRFHGAFWYKRTFMRIVYKYYSKVTDFFCSVVVQLEQLGREATRFIVAFTPWLSKICTKCFMALLEERLFSKLPLTATTLMWGANQTNS